MMKQRLGQKQRAATDTWRSLGCRTTPLEHWSKRKPTAEPRWIPFYWNFKILHFNRKCVKWVEISGCKMNCTWSVGYGLLVNVQKDEWIGLSCTLCTIFKICSQFLEIVIIEKIVKIPFLQKSEIFKCFIVWCTYLFTCTQWTCWKFG